MRLQRQRYRQPGAGLSAGHLAQQAGHEIAEFAINRPARPFKRCCAFTPTTVSKPRPYTPSLTLPHRAVFTKVLNMSDKF